MIKLIILKDDFTIYRFNPTMDIPFSIYDTGFLSITKTKDEISIVTTSKLDLKYEECNAGWKGFKVDGILDFSLIGIISDLTKPLKENNISLFVISTYNTDYIFVKEESFLKAVNVFKNLDYIDLNEE